MKNFLDSDRPLLLRACERAEEAQRPPLRLGQRPEAPWAALVADGDQELASTTFSPGDSEDAVRKLLEKFPDGAPAGATLYLTLEPKAGFDRLPPVTESVRRLGVRRVVIGTLDPAQRFRGEGHRVMEQMGILVVLADGEEARRCQHLLDDYAKWLSRGLAVLRAQVELIGGESGAFDLRFAGEFPPLRTDAVLCRAGGPAPSGDAWRVVLDPTGKEMPSEHSILYQAAPVPGSGVRVLPMRDGAPDLGSVLRDLGSLGFLSAEISGDPELFRLALKSGLIDSVTARFAAGADESARALSQLGKVRLSDGGAPLELRFNGARLVGGNLEARVELC